jgi:hypothetical protein
VRALGSRIDAWLPNGWVDPFRQLGLFVLADLCYETVRGIAEGQRAEAFANAASVIHFEKVTGTFVEPDIQSAFINHRWIIDAANFMYMNSHFVLTTGFLVWLYLYRNENFYFIRNMFMAAMALAIVGYVLMPTAPPRLIPGEGFTDTITAFAQVNHDSALVKIFVNPYAAIPSMHCAFSLMIGVSGVMLSKHRATKLFWAIYPLVVFFVVIVTANHFWIDGAIGWAVAAMAAVIALQVARLRPSWAWRPATA